MNFTEFKVSLKSPLLAASVTLLSVVAARSQITWDGQGIDDNWSTAANWVGNIPPANPGTDDLLFDGSTRLTPNVDTAWTLSSITFASTASAFTIGGSDLTPSSASTDFVINNSANLQALNNNISAIDGRGFNAAAGDLVFGGTIATQGSGLNVKGAANTTLNGNLTGTGFLNKDDAGILTLNGADNSYTANTFINSGTFQVNGALTASPFVSVFAGATLSGNGSISGSVVVGNNVAAANNGAVAPGNGVGTFTSGAMTWNLDSHYYWEINKAAGTQGSNPGSDLLAINGSLTLNGTPSDRITVHVVSLTLGGAPGPVSDFNSSQSRSWHIVSTSGGVTGFDANNITIDSSQFQNSLDGGSFSLSVNGNALDLNFTAVPEPAAYAAVTAVLLLGFGILRRTQAT